MKHVHFIRKFLIPGHTYLKKSLRRYGILVLANFCKYGSNLLTCRSANNIDHRQECFLIFVRPYPVSTIFEILK